MDIFSSVSIITLVSAGLGILAIRFRQPLIVAYILGGIIIGPWGFSIIKDFRVLYNLSHIGITLLLFLAGMDLHPERFFKKFKKLIPIVSGVCLFNSLIVMGCTLLLGYNWFASLMVGISLMFSSTLLFIRLMPKKTKIQQEVNSFSLAVLIIEDIIAVFVLMMIGIGQNESSFGWINLALLPVKGVFALLITYYGEKYVVFPLMKSIEKTEDIAILTAFGWCLGMALMYEYLGFSHEIGAFIAGITLSPRPISNRIESDLHFTRDFFLILFFFTLGAEIDLIMAQQLFFPTLGISIFLFIVKPPILHLFFQMTEEKKEVTKESSVRLGQASEFGLLISFLALRNGLITEKVSQFIQLIIIFTFILSASRIFYQYDIKKGT